MNKSFKDWTTFDLEQTFGLKKRSDKESVILKDWLNVANTVTDAYLSGELDDLRTDLIEYADIWNEEELKGFFIFPLIRLVRFKSDKYKVFYERKLQVKYKGIELKGDVDAMLASGTYNRIIAPFYCMQEYKPESRKSANDVRGQLLSEMLAAQALNTTDAPVYGTYLSGRFWFFAVLMGTEYSFSKGFVADSEEGIAFIFNALCKLKTLIDAQVA
jgi:hypothetical protein